MTTICRWTALLAVTLTMLAARAADGAVDTVAATARPVSAMFAFEAGRTHLRDTYLTPITYRGLDVGLAFEHLQATGFDPERWVRQLTVGVSYARVRNAAGNNTMHDLTVDARWALMRRWRLASGSLQLLGGGMTQLRGGGIYNAQNSNNVVSAKIHWNVGLAVMAAYRVPCARVPITLRWQVCLPVLGVFFSPEYDETYYEIYLGNRRNLAHTGWWGNRWDIDQLVSVDLRLGGTTLRVGYHNHIDHSRVSHIRSTVVRHAFVLAVGGEYLTLSPRRPTPARIVSPLF